MKTIYEIFRGAITLSLALYTALTFLSIAKGELLTFYWVGFLGLLLIFIAIRVLEKGGYQYEEADR